MTHFVMTHCLRRTLTSNITYYYSIYLICIVYVSSALFNIHVYIYINIYKCVTPYIYKLYTILEQYYCFIDPLHKITLHHC